MDDDDDDDYPCHPEYELESARTHSFRKYPKSLTHLILDMSKAGFYFTGVGDCTVCYYCGGGIKDWEKTDVPWIEHGKFYSHCRLVREHLALEARRNKRMIERQHRPLVNDKLCYECQRNKSIVCLLPCEHLCVCSECVNSIQSVCPKCYADVKDFVTVNYEASENVIIFNE